MTATIRIIFLEFLKLNFQEFTESPLSSNWLYFSLLPRHKIFLWVTILENLKFQDFKIYWVSYFGLNSHIFSEIVQLVDCSVFYLQASTSGKQSLKFFSFANYNQVSLSAQSIANFKIKEAIVSVFKLSAKVEDCLVEGPSCALGRGWYKCKWWRVL